MRDEELNKVIKELLDWISEKTENNLEAIAVLEATKLTISHSTLSKNKKDLDLELEKDMYG